MKKLRLLIFLIIISCISLLTTSCYLFQTDAQLIKKIASKVKEKYFEDKEILNINSPVLVLWAPSGSSIWIIALDDKGNWREDYDLGFMSLVFHAPPDYDKYGRGEPHGMPGPKAHFVEKFIEQANEKRLNGIVLTNFIQRDLIVTLEFSDGSKVIFDRYYKEIEENLDDFRYDFTTWGLMKQGVEWFLFRLQRNYEYLKTVYSKKVIDAIKEKITAVVKHLKKEKNGEPEKDWIEIRLLDNQTGKPIAQRKYTVKFDDGTERTGTTNDDGFLFENDIPSRNYELIFDGLDVIRMGKKFLHKRSNL